MIEHTRFWDIPTAMTQYMPTLEQLVNALKQKEESEMKKLGGWGNFSSIGMPMLSGNMGVDSPNMAFVNSAPNECFLVNRLASGRYSLKPNLSHHRYLYRGQNKAFEKILPSYRHSKFPLLIHNLKIEEFRILLDSHPLMKTL